MKADANNTPDAGDGISVREPASGIELRVLGTFRRLCNRDEIAQAFFRGWLPFEGDLTPVAVDRALQRVMANAAHLSAEQRATLASLEYDDLVAAKALLEGYDAAESASLAGASDDPAQRERFLDHAQRAGARAAKLQKQVGDRPVPFTAIGPTPRRNAPRRPSRNRRTRPAAARAPGRPDSDDDPEPRSPADDVEGAA